MHKQVIYDKRAELTGYFPEIYFGTILAKILCYPHTDSESRQKNCFKLPDILSNRKEFLAIFIIKFMEIFLQDKDKLE